MCLKGLQSCMMSNDSQLHTKQKPFVFNFIFDFMQLWSPMKHMSEQYLFGSLQSPTDWSEVFMEMEGLSDLKIVKITSFFARYCIFNFNLSYIFYVPIEIKDHTVPHFESPVNGKVDQSRLEHGHFWVVKQHCVAQSLCSRVVQFTKCALFDLNLTGLYSARQIK